MVVFYGTILPTTRRPRMAAFDLALARVREQDIELVQHLPARINQLARAAGHAFRDTELTPGNTLGLFLRQVACGNVACTAVRHLADSDFSDSAWCQARKRLPVDLIRRAQRLLVDRARRELDASDDVGEGAGGYRWRGHRLHAVDGTSDSMPDTPPLRSHYGVPSGCRPGLGFPTSHLLLLMDHRSGLFLDCADGPMFTSDVSRTPALHAHLAAGDVLLGDDAFAGWAHLALILQANLHAIFPAHHRRIVDFTAGRAHAHPRRGKSSKRAGKPRSRVVEVLGPDDQLVEYFKPTERPAWIGDEQWAALPASITVREVRRTVRRDGFRPMTVTIVTTLLDPAAYPADELIELRLSRWMIETNIRHLKTTLGMDVLQVQDARRRPQGAVDVPAGVQPDPGHHAARRAAAAGERQPRELRRRAGVGALRAADRARRRRRAGRQPAAPRPPGAARAQAAEEGVPIHDPAAVGAEGATPRQALRYDLASCH
jgi:hypothetical protein